MFCPPKTWLISERVGAITPNLEIQMKADCEPNFIHSVISMYFSSVAARLRPFYSINSLRATANADVNESPAPVESTNSKVGWSSNLTAGTLS